MGKHLVEFYGTPRGWISIKPVFPRVKISQNSSFSILNQNFCLKIHLKNRFIRIKSIPKKIQNNEKKIKTKKKTLRTPKNFKYPPNEAKFGFKKNVLDLPGPPGPRPAPGGAFAPARFPGPAPGGAVAPANFPGPAPGGVFAPDTFAGPAPGGA